MIAFRGTATALNAPTDTQCPITPPVLLPGDFIIASIAAAGASTTVTPPDTSWANPLGSGINGASISHWLFTRTINSNDQLTGQHFWTFSAVGAHAVSYLVLSGVTGVNLVASGAGSTVTPTLTLGAISPGTPAVIYANCVGNGDTLSYVMGTTNPGGWVVNKVVEAVNLPGSSTGRCSTIAMAMIPPSQANINTGGVTVIDNSEGGSADQLTYQVLHVIGATEPVYSSLRTSANTTSWKFVLARTADLAPLYELTKAKQKTITWTLNRPGKLSFSINGTLASAAGISALSTCVLAYKGDTICWSGPVWSIDEAIPGDTMNVQCVGWQELLNHRLVAPKQEWFSYYSVYDAGTVASALLSLANDQFASLITMGTVQATQFRTRAYKRFQNIGQEIQALSDVEAGYDIEITPDTRTMNVWSFMGNDLRSSVAFGYLTGPGHNLASVQRQISSDKTVNRMYVMGDSTAVQVDDPPSQALYPMFEEQVQLPGVNDNSQQQSFTYVPGATASTLLQAYANAEMLIRDQPLVIYNIVPMPADNTTRVPRLFVDYGLGDIVKFSAKHGRFNVQNKAARVFSITVSIDENGVEKVTSLQTTATGS